MGMNDIGSDNLQQELEYGYSFTDTRISERMNFLMGQLNQIRTEANQLKTTYTEVEKAFVQSVKEYDCGSATNKLGNNWVNNVTYRASGGGNASAIEGEDATKIKDKTVLQQDPVDKIFFVSASDGKYQVTKVSVIPYNPDDSLNNRIDQLMQFMDVPSRDGNIFGYRKDGTYAAACQCKNQVNGIQKTLKSLIDQINSIGGSYDITIMQSKDLLTRIDDFQKYVSTVFSESELAKDPQIAVYNGLHNSIMSLISEQSVYVTDYDKVMESSEQQSYLKDYQKPQYLTVKGIDGLISYAETKDESNMKTIMLRSQQIIDGLDNAEQQYAALVTKIQHDTYTPYDKTSEYPVYKDESYGVVEIGLSGLYDYFYSDYRFRYSDMMFNKVETELDTVRNSVSALRKDIVTVDDTYGRTVQSLIEERIRFYDITQDEQYNDKYSMFLTYGGQEVCYYPYFNYKNITHPSYQIHPYLWNFVTKEDFIDDTLSRVFSKYDSEALNSVNYSKNIDKLYGEYGQLINKWMYPDEYDYSGYTTRYESSDNKDSKNQQVYSEVIDYDGAFYPPAGEELKMYYDEGKIDNLVNSVHDGVSIKDVMTDIRKNNVLSAELTSYIEVKGNTDEYGNLTSYTYVRDISMESTIAPYIEPYVRSHDIGQSINDYFSTVLSNGRLDDVDIDDMLHLIQSNTDETYYFKYYKHLDMNSEQRQYVSEQIREYSEYIIDSFIRPRDKSDESDIYKYGMDENGNMFILFKKYNSVNPSYKEKKNTAGDLWIRLDDSPLAFPSFWGKHPNIKPSDTSKPYFDYFPTAIRYLSEDDYYVHVPFNRFYDFEMSNDRRTLFIVSQIANTEDGTMPSDGFIQNYENPWVIICPITNIDGIFISLGSGNDIGSTSFMQSGYDISRRSSLFDEEITEDITDYYALLNIIPKNSSQTIVVYARKDVHKNKTKTLRDDIKIYTVNEDLVKSDSAMMVSGFMRTLPHSDQICVAYAKGVLTVAYLGENKIDESANVVNNRIGSSTDISRNTKGSPFGDPRTTEMNSHDVFDSNVVISKIDISTNIPKVKHSSEHNTNADMSFIPVYPGVSGEVKLSSITDDMTIKNEPFQLLGYSKNIDGYIDGVNTETNPYFDYDTMISGLTHGRVYEDFDPSKDNTFRHFTNPPLSERDSLEFTWEIELSGYEYTDRQIDTLNVLIYNNKTLGKNPYHMSKITDIPHDEISVENYNSEYDIENRREIVISTDRTTEDDVLEATGTFDMEHTYNDTDSNHIDNISNIMLSFDREHRKITVKFVIEDEQQSTFIEKGSIQLLLFNTNDLHMFEYYHYLDNGCVNLLDNAINIPEDYGARGWKFIYDRSRYSEDYVLSAARAFYRDTNGKKVHLEDISLSDYYFLSDVYILQGNNRLSFKYDETDIFDFDNENYYFPTLNTKYPKSNGEAAYNIISNTSKVNNAALSDIFDDDNKFIMDMYDRYDISKMMTTVDIPVNVENDDGLMIFEKYTEFTDDYCLSDDFLKYSPDDSRTLGYAIFDEKYTYNPPERSSADIEEAFDNSVSTIIDTEECIADIAKEENANMHVVFSESDEFATKEYSTWTVKEAAIRDLMKIYVNYKCEEDGIYLYFNYFNYINTPFIRSEDGVVYPDIIDDTYLKLATGENGVLNIVMQMKTYVNGKLTGYRNGILAKYSIYNISDDKPKFTIREIYHMKPQDMMNVQTAPNVSITVGNADMDISGIGEDEYPTSSVSIMISKDSALKTPYEINVEYPAEIIKYSGNGRGYGYLIDATTRGMLNITVTEKNVSSINMNIDSLFTKQELIDNRLLNGYVISLDNTVINGENGIPSNVTLTDGILNIHG